MASRIMEYISPSERAESMKVGAYQKFATAGVPINRINGIVKRAVDLPSPSGVAKSVIALSVITGIPVGIAAHIIGNRVTSERGREKELTTQAGYYRNATSQLRRGLQAADAVS